nr:GAF domain-containing protein [Chloroflexota bacterium]
MATLEEERRKLRTLQQAVLGFAWVMIVGRELVYCFLKKMTIQESILSALVMMAIATVLVEFGFRAIARWYPTELRRFQESLVLLDIATAVSSTLDLTQMLKLIAQRTAEACQAHRCSILLFDEQRQRILPLMSQYASGATDKELWERFRYRTYAQRVEEVPVLKRVIEDRQPLVLSAATISSLPEAWTKPFNICSLLIVPLIARDCVIGIMALDHVEPIRHFTHDQINLAMTIGSQVAVALENARLHQQIREEKAKTEVILQEMFSGIIAVDHDLRILSLNPGAEAITGYPANQVIGKQLVEVFGEDIAAPDSPLARAMESGEKVPPVETTLSGLQGMRDVLLGVTPLSGVGRSATQYLLSFADITKLKEVDRLKSSIVANVSHELRAPLSSIKAYTELLLSNAEGANEALRREWLSVIDRETERLTALINDLLNLSRLESGHFELTKVPIYLGEVITDVVISLQVQAKQRGIAIELDLQPDLPRLVADDNLIRIVVRNLVSNAIKFSYDGGRVYIRAWKEGEDIKFYVQDEGVGIAQEAIPYLFTKFFRVPSAAAADVQGTGLGLALAKEGVVAHGGRIEVESTLGKGSRFTVTIPLTGEAASNESLDATETDGKFSRHQ